MGWGRFMDVKKEGESVLSHTYLCTYGMDLSSRERAAF